MSGHLPPRRFNRRDVLQVLGVGVGLGAARALPWNAEALSAAQNVFTSVRAVDVPEGAIIRTLLEDLSPDAFVNGATLVHEHLNTDVELMVEELEAAAADGLGGLVSLTTGRRTDDQVESLRQIASRSPVRIVLGGGYLQDTGFHFYPASVSAMSESQLVEELVSDATRHRWGAMGEIGTSLQLRPDERKMLRAVGQVSARTGLPILTHVPHEGCPTCAIEQLDIFLSQGAKPENVCIGHLATIQTEQDPTMETHKTIAKRGAFIDFGPELLYRTPHAVVGTSFHHAAEGLRDTYNFFRATDDRVARRILAVRGIDLVMICPAAAEAALYRAAPGDGATLLERIEAGAPPVWLVHVMLPSALASDFLLFTPAR